MIEVFELLSKVFGIAIAQYTCNIRNVVLLGGQQFKCFVHFEWIDIVFGRVARNLSYLIIKSSAAHAYINPEKPDVPLNKNDAFQKVQKRRVQEKRWARSYSAWSKPTVFLSLEPSLNGFKISFKSHCRFKIISYLYAIVRLLYLTPHPASCTASCLYI